MTGLHTKITFSFLPVGHTKFYPDLGFDLFKRHLRMSKVSTMEEVAQCMTASTPVSNMLTAQLVSNESGDVFVPSYDWQTKLGHFHAIPQLKKYRHFVFAQPGVVHCYVDSNDKVGVSFVICTPDSISDKLPTQLYTDGLEFSRKNYLFHKIRQFCPDYAQHKTFSVLHPALIMYRLLGLSKVWSLSPDTMMTVPPPQQNSRWLCQLRLAKVQYAHFADRWGTEMLYEMVLFCVHYVGKITTADNCILLPVSRLSRFSQNFVEG